MRESACEKDGWSVWMLLTVQVACPSPPSFLSASLTHTSTAESWLWAERLYCRQRGLQLASWYCGVLSGPCCTVCDDMLHSSLHSQHAEHLKARQRPGTGAICCWFVTSWVTAARPTLRLTMGVPRCLHFHYTHTHTNTHKPKSIYAHESMHRIYSTIWWRITCAVLYTHRIEHTVCSQQYSTTV